MPVDHIRYDLLTQQALRGVVREVLFDAARNGLPGDHHFFVTFDTRAPDVSISSRLREKYPEEMTIVLQHQFWDLEVSELGFSVGLSFSGIPEKLEIPFSAITGFFDPSVQFGLKFELSQPGEQSDEADAEHERPAAATAAPAAAPAADEDDTSPPGGQAPSGGAEVVRLDRFRKK
jgi:hypothetical protein